MIAFEERLTQLQEVIYVVFLIIFVCTSYTFIIESILMCGTAYRNKITPHQKWPVALFCFYAVLFHGVEKLISQIQ